MNVFLTQLIFGASELPAHILCIWLLEALGRRVMLMSTLLIGGFSCILILAVPEGKAFLTISMPPAVKHLATDIHSFLILYPDCDSIY